jgi:hypothetical protein
MSHERNEKIVKKNWIDNQKIKNLFLQVDFEKNLDRLNQETGFIQKENFSRTKTPFPLKKCFKITHDGICLNFNIF